jgi:transcriptional regulator with XRE-family HTH domain
MAKGKTPQREVHTTVRIPESVHGRLREIAARIRDLRERSPLRQQDVADRVGVELRTYQKWEQKGTGWENLEKLAEVYGTTAEAIWKGETPDLTATFNGSVPRELQAQLDRIEAKLDQLLNDDEGVPPPPEGALTQPSRSAPPKSRSPGRPKSGRQAAGRSRS